MRKSLRLLSAAAVLASAGLAALPASAQSSKLHFRTPVYVDTQLAGSEGFVMYAAKSHRLIYVTHEGSTLLYRSGLTGAPTGDGDFVSNYRNQVNLWTSKDSGKSWQRVNWNGTGFFT